MHHQNNSTATNSPVFRHIRLIGIGVIVLTGLYFLFRNLSVVVAGGITLVLAHLLAVGLVAAVGGKGLQLLMQKLYGVPDTEDNAPETEGGVIRWAGWYDRLVKFLMLGNEQQLRESSASLAQIQPGETVLDVGCGTGSLTIVAAERAGETGKVYGIDPAPEMILLASKKAVKAGVNIDFRVGLVEKTDFADNAFDVVLSSFMVHHLPGNLQQRAFAEIYRVLKPGGRLLVVDFEPPVSPVKRALLRLFLGHEMMHIENQNLPGLFEDAGFTNVTAGKTDHWSAAYAKGVKQ